MRPLLAALPPLLAVIALALPPRATAACLVGAGSPALDRVVIGAWIFKALLLFHAVAAALLLRRRGPEDLSRAQPDEEPPPPAGAAPAGPPAWRDPALAAIVAAALALRLVALGEGPWFDEIHTLVEYVRRPAGEILADFASLNNHLLVSLAAVPAARLLGEGAVALRLPAVLFGVAGVAATAAWGRDLLGRREALLAAALLAVSYHHVWFSQNGRGYTGLLLAAVVGTHALWRALTGPATRAGRAAALYAASLALGLLTHLSAAFVLAGHGLVWLGWLALGRRRASGPPPWRSRRQLAVAAALLLAVTGALQVYAFALPQLAGSVATVLAGGETGAPAPEPGPGPGPEPGPGPPTPAASPAATAAAATDAEAAPATWKRPAWLLGESLAGLARGAPGGVLGLAAGAAVALAGVASLARRRPLALALMVAPGLVTAAVLLAADRNLWPRFFFFGAGFAALAVVRGTFAAARTLRLPAARRWATAAVLLAAAASAATLPRAWAPKQRYAAAPPYLAAAGVPDGRVAAVGMAGYVYDRYHGEPWARVDTAAELARVEAGGERTWAVYTFPTRIATVDPALWRRLESGYREVARFPGTVGGGDVVVAARREGAP